VALSGYCLGNSQLTDFQPADIDIEVRQQRTFGGGRQQFGHAPKIRRGDDERTDINMAAKEGKGPPVNSHDVGGGKHAFWIADFQVGNFHLAVQRSPDLADVELQPVFEFERLDLLLDKVVAAAAVQPDIGSDQQHQYQRQQRSQPDPRFREHCPLRTWFRHGFGLRHQKA